ncbi:hypothetical protein EDD17DRAFT_1510467 [Pisolithus thermaeus]|nr:hypothetical protein EV401DRAFT_1889296 [Pisolithus croceorrhizus]KAI6160376.1 hypothetical protein EDD17DRAFT_1510467 [Pisolithus thermaeus]
MDSLQPKISIDEMLQVFLVDCDLGSSDKDVLLKDCLEAVLPICNGSFQAMDVEVKASDVKYYLHEYSKKYSENEENLYPDFVKAANAALRCLQSLYIPGIRPCCDSVYFHLNNSPLLRQNHQGKVSEWKPDIILVSDDDALEACDSEKDITNPYEIAFTEKTRPPFNWRSVRTFVASATSKRKMEAPPEVYTCQPDAQPPKCKYVGAHVLDHTSISAQSHTLSDAPMSSATDSRPSTREPFGWSQAADSTREKMLEQLEPSESQSERQMSVSEMDQPLTAQAECYAAEMFAVHRGRQHVIGLIIIGCFNFIQDLPRFLVLLLAMQRFENCHWGLNPHIDPRFGDCPKSLEVIFPDEQGRDIDITLELSSDERVAHIGLTGRSTNVFPAKSKALRYEDDMVAKVFWAEESRRSEPEICRKSRRSSRFISDPLSKLIPITKLVGTDFLHTWWATVKCHLNLWKSGVYHRDVSPSNLRFCRTSDGTIMGVLNDFDLASTEGDDIGTERTGTVPFMALDLLRRHGIYNQIKHGYQHDAESFIWVLAWITLRYDNGMLRATGRPLDEWLNVDAPSCVGEKLFFLDLLGRKDLQAGSGHEKNLQVANECLNKVLEYRISRLTSADQNPIVMEVDVAFKRFLGDPVSPFLVANE